MRTWRLLIDGPKSGKENMATDEAILIACSEGCSSSTLRLYEWNSATLSIGCFQKASTIIERSSEVNIPIVRRISGGRAVLHFDEITYSIVCVENEPLFNEGIAGAYKTIATSLLSALREVGVNADMHTSYPKDYTSKKLSCFHSPSRYEIMIENRKLVGSAQRRFKRVFLQHGSILFDIDKELISKLFGNDAIFRMAWLNLFSAVKKCDFKAVLSDKIREGLNIQLRKDNISNDEIFLRDKLIKERYNNDAWNIYNIYTGLENADTDRML